MRVFHRGISSNKLNLSLVLLLLVGCEQEHEQPPHAAQAVSAAQVTTVGTGVHEGNAATLADVISQSHLPHDTHKPYPQDSEQQISSLQLSYAGRYYTMMSCDEALIRCDQGQVQYILNLLPDGTAHRMLVRPGRVYVRHEGPVQSYRQDLWSFDPETHEVIIHLREGAEVFYLVDQQNNLQMELDKTLNYDEDNKRFFTQHYPAPSYAYKLIRDTEHKSESKVEQEKVLVDTHI